VLWMLRQQGATRGTTNRPANLIQPFRAEISSGALDAIRFGLFVLLLHKESIHVEVKTAEVVTQQDGRALDEGAEIEFRRWAGIAPPQVAGDRRPFIVTRQDDHLHACEDSPGRYPTPPRRYCG